MPNTAAWVDTGFLVALFARNDAHFSSAVAFLDNAKQLEPFAKLLFSIFKT